MLITKKKMNGIKRDESEISFFKSSERLKRNGTYWIFCRKSYQKILYNGRNIDCK